MLQESSAEFDTALGALTVIAERARGGRLIDVQRKYPSFKASPNQALTQSWPLAYRQSAERHSVLNRKLVTKAIFTSSHNNTVNSHLGCWYIALNISFPRCWTSRGLCPII